MPGFMGLRGHNPQNPHDKNRERREEDRATRSAEQERRANEKVQEILRDQEGDMTAFTGSLKNAGELSDCDRVCNTIVGEIMSSKVAALSFDDNLLTVQGIFARVKFRHLPVVNERHEVIGIISDRDFLRVVSPFFGTVNEQNRDKEIMTRKVGTIMTRKPICATIDTTILEAVKLMNSRKISCLPIVKRGELLLLGIVTWKDVVRAYCPRAFNASRDSNRLRSGVTLNPETAESARLRARVRPSTRVLARPDAGKTGESGRHQPPPPSASPRRCGSDTSHIIRQNTPHIAATEKLRDDSTAGQAGSDLAAKQRARMREQLEKHNEDCE